jgi:integrase
LFRHISRFIKKVLTGCLPKAQSKTVIMPKASISRKDRISKRSVDELTCPPDEDRAFLWDNALTGFCLVAFPSGRKVYYVQYRQAGRSRRAAIGGHGRLTPEEARIEAKKLLGDTARGIDPLAERKAVRSVPLFRDIAAEFMDHHIAPKRKPRTLDTYETLLRLHILPSLGNLRMTEIRRAHISKMHLGASHPGAANRALTVVSAIWNWAAAEHEELVLPQNPVKGLSRNPEQSRERFLDHSELARLGEALARAETEGLSYDVDETKPTAKHAPKPENRRRLVDPFAVAAIRLLLFTGARLREILHAKWEYVDFERGLLNLPDSKTGKKAIILSAAALDVLAALPRLGGNPFIFPGGKDGRPRADLKRPWDAITQAAGLQGVRIHDLRHSFASIGAGRGLGLPIIGKLLGHATPRMTAKYAHLDNDPIRRAADQIGETIAAALSPNPQAEVVSLKAKRRPQRKV